MFPMKRPDKPSVFIALASYSKRFRPAFVEMLEALVVDERFHGVEFQFRIVPGESLVTRARNNLAWQFLQETECEAMLCIDIDLHVTPEMVLRVIENWLPVCGGRYPAKQPELRWILTPLNGNTAADANGLLKVQEIGTGFFWVLREVLEGIINAFPEISYLCDARAEMQQLKWDFFSVGVVNHRLMSEDYFFCFRARQIGYDVIADTTINIGHDDWLLASQADGTFKTKFAECEAETVHFEEVLSRLVRACEVRRQILAKVA